DHGARASHSSSVLAEHILGCRPGRRLLGLAHGDSYSPQMARRGKGFISRRMRAMTGSAEIARYRTNLQDELDGAAVYAALAAAEADPVRKDLFLQLSQAEAEHAKVWKEKLAAAGIQDVRYAPSLRMRLLARLALRFGPRFVLPAIAATEFADRNKYSGQADAAALSSEEQGHAAVVQAVAARGWVGGTNGKEIATAERWHRGGPG